MDECIFCKIANGQIPAKKVYEDDHIMAFHDLSPQAPVHVLIIPKRHADNLTDARTMEDELLARLLRKAADIACEFGLDTTGFRIVSNTGEDACQSVNHLHIHLLGGKKMSGELA